MDTIRKVAFDGTVYTEEILANGRMVRRVYTDGGGEQITKQDAAHETDINYIVKNYTRSGQLPPVIGEPVFGDFASAAIELDTALDLVARAKGAFELWPARAREAALNDPSYALAMLGTQEGRDALEAAGLDLAGLKPVSTKTPAGGAVGDGVSTNAPVPSDPAGVTKSS